MIVPTLTTLFPGASAMHARMREHDWSSSALGLPADWPASLQVMCNTILDCALPTAIAWGPQFALLYNDAFRSLLDADEADRALGQSARDCRFWHNSGDFFQRAMQGESFHTEALGSSSDHESGFSCSPLRDDEHRLAGVCCIGMHSARRRSAAAAKPLLSSGQEVGVASGEEELGVWIWNPDTDEVSWQNSRPWEFFGLPPSAPAVTATQFLNEFVHPEDAEQFRRASALTLEHGKHLYFKGRIIRRNGQQRWLEFFGQRIAVQGAQQARLVFGTAADITEHVEAEARRRENETRYHTLFDSIDEGFCIIEMLYDQAGKPSDYRFLEANPAFVRQTGLVDAVGKTMKELVPMHDQYWFDTYGEVVSSQMPLRFQNEAAALGRWFDVYAMPFGAPDSKRVAVLFTDFSDRKLAEIKLQRLADDLAESDRRKTEFLALLAHELRNPLAPICNGIHLMRLAADNPETVARVRDMMDRQLNQMVRLVNDLLDLSRITNDKLELRKEVLDLKGVIASAVETSLPLIESRRHVLSVHTPEEALPVEIDPARISQVISNLLNNAAKYTPDEGRIALSVAREDDHVKVAVTDSGIGIPQESLSSVFDMFAQVGPTLNRGGGLGIGLSLVKRLVELHGGNVRVSSEGTGRGSGFEVWLPLLERDLQQANPSAPQAGVPLEKQGQRILVVDDNSDAANTLSSMLQIAGHQTRVADSGLQALDLAPHFRPEVVFLDIGMPEMNGYEVAHAMRKMPELQSVVLVALTGWGTAEDQARARAAGFDHHLTKPASLAAITALLESPARGTLNEHAAQA